MDEDAIDAVAVASLPVSVVMTLTICPPLPSSTATTFHNDSVTAAALAAASATTTSAAAVYVYADGGGGGGGDGVSGTRAPCVADHELFRLDSSEQTVVIYSTISPAFEYPCYSTTTLTRSFEYEWSSSPNGIRKTFNLSFWGWGPESGYIPGFIPIIASLPCRISRPL